MHRCDRYWSSCAPLESCAIHYLRGLTVRSWEGLLRKEHRIDIEDTRSAMVRVSVIAYLGCVMTGLLSLSVARLSSYSTAGSITVIAVAFLTAIVLWAFQRRVPLWLLVVQAPYAALLLAVGLWAGVPGLTPMYSLFYVLVVLYGTFFFRSDMAAALIFFCTLCFAAAGIARGDPGWLTQVLLVFGASVTIGLFTGLLVNRFQEGVIKDGLTGLINRRMWESLVEQELSKAERSKQPFSILLVDLDGFKAVNDKHGHLHGDRLLKRVAESLSKVVRDADAPCRWGGDEFTVLLTDCGHDKVKGVVDRIRAHVEEGLTLSIGSATWKEGASLANLFQQADKRLYEAKANKRAS